MTQVQKIISSTVQSISNTFASTMVSLPKTYKAATFEKKGEGLTVKDVELKHPSNGQVLVKVLATGVCHSDAGVQAGEFGNSYPIVPGHETIGDVVEIAEGETKWKVGDRVGGPWHGGRMCYLSFLFSLKTK